jgi:hypothetical protein
LEAVTTDLTPGPSPTIGEGEGSDSCVNKSPLYEMERGFRGEVKLEKPTTTNSALSVFSQSLQALAVVQSPHV